MENTQLIDIDNLTEPIDYDILYNIFNKYYTIEQLLNICEKNQLSIYGNREMIIDRLSYYFSEGRYKNNLKYKIKDCFNKILLRINNYYQPIK
jgi:hypothetical protein